MIAVVGRVVEGIDKLSSLPRGTEALGFYKDKAQFVPIASIRLASDIPAAERPAYEVYGQRQREPRSICAFAPIGGRFCIRPAGGSTCATSPCR